MAKRANTYRGFAKVSGSKIGARTMKVRMCNKCGLQHPPGQKPERCISKGCGGLSFTTFDSVGEAGRWHTLCRMEARGKITDLKRQVRFNLMAAHRLNGALVENKVAQYVADFTYTRDGKEIIEDYKGGAIDPVAALKLKWMEAMGKPVKLVGG